MSELMVLSEALTEYAELEGSELGELLQAMIGLAGQSLMSDELKLALTTDMKAQLLWLQENAEIVEEEYEQAQTTKVKVRELRFL